MVWLVLWRNQGSRKSQKGYRLAVPALSRALDTGTAQVGLCHDFQSVGESDGALIGDTGCPFWIHALVLVNLGGCTGQEVIDLADAVTADVYKKFGITLEKEAIIL